MLLFGGGHNSSFFTESPWRLYLRDGSTHPAENELCLTGEMSGLLIGVLELTGFFKNVFIYGGIGT